MGLFFEILSAINNPNQNGSVDQLSTVMNGLQQVGGDRIDPNTMQTVLSTVGGFLAPSLKQQMLGGALPVDGILSQLTGGNIGSGLLSSILTPQLQQQIAQAVAQKTGMDATMIQTMLPSIVPAVLGFFKMGEATPGSGASNSVLQAFLDSDRDGDTDLGDVFKFAGRFLNRPA
ncbi:DUF937 domain-containing protein [Merismopedia glauca]|uniref:DUF937 domain-containing protein n=1 Tax=Merismopedia glauca CCAP 1448/3 TaxID=1296344 RepID=A0A2T1C006_9CYAN|nr:DUF937 domain-containing protein [Merismopedia glauca]PSB01591.1 DUF937 domain-containing protein [Merismopedia glauca CCAP 1448/3]